MIPPAPLRLLAVALLLPVSVAAETPWDCTLQTSGQWVCNSKAPPQAELPALDSNEGISPETGKLPAAPVTGETSGKDRNSTLSATAAGEEFRQETEPAGPAQEGTAAISQATGSDPGTAATAADTPGPGAEAVSSTTEAEPAGTAPGDPEPVAAQPAAVEETGYDRWALCPPVVRPTPLPESIDADTINLQADSAQASDGNVYTLDGNAIVEYREQRMEAENIVYRQDSGQIEVPQGIRYTQPDLYISGENAILYPELHEGELHKVDYVLYQQHGRGEAKVLHLDGVTRQRLEGAYYTTCPPEKKDWILSAKEVVFDEEEGTGTARNAKLSLKGVPVLYTPYARFPIDDRRMSGLLFPKVGQTNETGLDISVPYYWNIAPNRDMTIIPRYMSDRGTMLGTEFRYLNTHSNGSLSGDYLPSDKRRDNEDRSLVSIRHRWKPVPRLQTRIIASNASDVYYFEDLGNSLLQTSRTNLERTAAADYQGTWWDLSMMVQDYQTVSPNVSSANRPYKQLPQVAFNAVPERRLLGMKFQTSAEFNHFRHSDDSIVEGSRLDVQPRLSLPVYHAAWFLDPAVSLRHTTYDLNNTSQSADDSPSRTVPIASLDAGTFFDRNGHWGDSNYVQTLEPRLFYLYVPDKNQDDLPVFDTGDYDFNYWTLFRENRFSGPDRMGDANQLAVALTSRILEPASGQQLMSASLGSLLYFSDRNVTLPGDPVETDNSSDIIGEFMLALSRQWNANATLHWDPHDSRTSRNDYRLQYQRGPRQLVNMSYRQQRGLLEQTDLSFLWPLSPSWHMVGRWYYSIKSSETIEILGGIGYESCCWTLQVLAQSFISSTEDDKNNSVFMQLELKGLGKLGTWVDDALERDILGYEAD
jgi:LPS-assembly protein